MKKIFTVLTLLILVTAAVKINAQENQDWKWVHPQPQGQSLNYAKVIDANTFYAFAGFGTFIKSTDAGLTWKVYPTATWTAYSGWFFNANTGLVCCYEGKIFRTTNGGNSWDSIVSPTGYTLKSMQFINSTVGFIGGGGDPFSGSVLLKTTDAGLTWTELNTGITTTINGIFALDELNIFAATSQGNLRKTTDGGVNWTTVNTGTTSKLNDVHFSDANTGMVSGGGTMRVTTDGGTSWSNASTGSTGNHYKILSTKTPVPAFYVCGNFNGLYKTTNNGLNWTLLPFAYNSTFAWNSFDINGDNIFAVGGNGLMEKSTNQGNSFTSLTLNVAPGSLNMDMWADSINGKVIVIGNRIMISTNGGETWTASGMVFQLNSLEMIDKNNGVIVGSNSQTIKTTDGGFNWNPVNGSCGTNKYLSEVEFPDASTGYIFQLNDVGGGFWKSTDGGDNWTIKTTGVNDKIGTASFVDANVGFAGNDNMKLMKTTNGGTSWTELVNTPYGTQGTGYRIYNMKFFNADSGYACAFSNATLPGRIPVNLIKTTDGGATFEVITNFQGGAGVYDMYWFDFNNGWIFQTGGAQRTTNGGATWEGFPTSSGIIYGSHMFDMNSGFITGVSGYVFKLTNTSKHLNLTALIQGFYDGSTLVSDTVTVELRNASSPYALVDQSKLVLNTSGNGTANFSNAADATNYYIALKHHNSIETWSKLPQQFTGGSLTYDFTTAVTQAYSDGISGNLPMVQKGSKWCFWSGEVTNSYFIEFDDLLQIYNFYLLGLEDPGYYPEDLTYNGFVEFDDVLLVYNNYTLGICIMLKLKRYFSSN